MKAQEIITMLKNEQDRKVIYKILMDCGKIYELSIQDKTVLKSTILEYCDYPNDIVRSAAIRVLCFYWGMVEFREKAFEMFANEEEDDETRADALMSWANTYRKTNNRKVIEFLTQVFQDVSKDMMIRAGAYSYILTVSPIEPKDYPNTEIGWDNFDAEIDWDLLNSILEKAL
jgi:hypothetical protein